ncbi:MAG: hypothetical protein WC750_03610 [Patescibacteria group bacterium]|jgi:hypothetical protein
MSKKSENKTDVWRRYVGLGIVCLIVIGVAALAIASSKLKPTVDSRQSTVISQQPTNQGRRPAFLVLDDNRSSLIDLNSSSTRDIKWPDDISRLGTPLSQIQGVDLQTGQTIWLDSEFKKAPSNIFRAPDGRHDVSLASDRQDGSSAVQVKQGNEVTTLVLRQKNGRQITEGQLLGWLDNDNIAVTGLATSTKAIFVLGLEGDLSLLAFLPDDAWLIKIFDGSVYYARAATGEGIESPQQPPSSIWRVASGKTEKIVNDTAHVIQNFVVSSNTVYYSLEDNTIKVSENGNSKFLGSGRLLMSVPGQGVLVSQDGQLILIKPDGQSRPLNLDAKNALFYLSQASLDETP